MQSTMYSKRKGVLWKQSAGELPRGRAQAYNIKRSLQHEHMSKALSAKIPAYLTRDLLFVVMEQCKYAEKTNAFVQDVTCAPEPMSVLSTQQQLNDLLVSVVILSISVFLVLIRHLT